MAVSKIRPTIEMPALELNTKMFLDVDPNEHYLAFAVDDPRLVLPQDMSDMLVQYPGVGKGAFFLPFFLSFFSSVFFFFFFF